jgi:hypothetical protein
MNVKITTCRLLSSLQFLKFDTCCNAFAEVVPPLQNLTAGILVPHILFIEVFQIISGKYPTNYFLSACIITL